MKTMDMSGARAWIAGQVAASLRGELMPGLAAVAEASGKDDPSHLIVRAARELVEELEARGRGEPTRVQLEEVRAEAAEARVASLAELDDASDLGDAS